MKNEKQTKQPQGGRRSQARKTAKAKKKSSLPVKWIIGAVFVVIVLAYGIGVYHYKDHFHRDTYVNGISLGGMTLDEAERTFTDDLESHKIALEEKERTEIIDPQDIDTVISVGTQIEDLYKSQSPWNWFTHFFGKDESTVTLDVSFDEDKLEEVVDSLECFDKANVVAPEDAYIKAGETQFEIVPEVLGNTIKKNQLLEAIKTGLATGVTVINLEEENLYKLPEYYEDDEAVQKMRHAVILIFSLLFLRERRFISQHHGIQQSRMILPHHSVIDAVDAPFDFTGDASQREPSSGI